MKRILLFLALLFLPLAAHAQAQMSGDCTISNLGVMTCPQSNGNAIATFSSTATSPVVGNLVEYAGSRGLSGTGIVVSGTGGLSISAAAGLSVASQPINATGTWTPIDASGASLVFTSVAASFTRTGNMIFAYGTLTYPATASGASNLIGGLPIPVASSAPGSSPSVGRFPGTALVVAVPLSGTTNFQLHSYASDGIFTNSGLASTPIFFNLVYPAQ